MTDEFLDLIAEMQCLWENRGVDASVEMALLENTYKSIKQLLEAKWEELKPNPTIFDLDMQERMISEEFATEYAKAKEELRLDQVRKIKETAKLRREAKDVIKQRFKVYKITKSVAAPIVLDDGLDDFLASQVQIPPDIAKVINDNISDLYFDAKPLPSPEDVIQDLDSQLEDALAEGEKRRKSASHLPQKRR